MVYISGRVSHFRLGKAHILYPSLAITRILYKVLLQAVHFHFINSDLRPSEHAVRKLAKIHLKDVLQDASSSFSFSHCYGVAWLLWIQNN